MRIPIGFICCQNAQCQNSQETRRSDKMRPGGPRRKKPASLSIPTFLENPHYNKYVFLQVAKNGLANISLATANDI